MENVKVIKIEERDLWNIITEESAEYLVGNGYCDTMEQALSPCGKRTERTGASFSDDAESASASFSAISGLENGHGEDSEHNMSIHDIAEKQNAKLEQFRMNTFLPCYMSDAEARALLFLTDAFAQTNSGKRTAKKISLTYAANYGLPLPNETVEGIKQYVESGECAHDKVGWESHAVNFLSMYDSKSWQPSANIHQKSWEKAVNSGEEHSAKWSAFFHALNTLRACPSSVEDSSKMGKGDESLDCDSSAEAISALSPYTDLSCISKSASMSSRVIRKLTVGGFSNRNAIETLIKSIESERSLYNENASDRASDESVYNTCLSILSQADKTVRDAVNSGDLGKMCTV